MGTLKRFFTSILQIPQEILTALIRFVVIIILLILYLFYWLLNFWKKLKKRKDHDADLKPDDCHKLPPHVTRKPNPCIYSQFYRSSQGLSVTWDNPDIEIFLPNGTLVDSSNLTSNTDYILKARISNASFDPSLATAVKCFYRPYSFNTPDKKPIETNPNGTEKVVYLDIAPWSAEIAEFKWHTPDVASAHYCIQVECFHIDDINPDNNLGQENTNVRAIEQDETVTTQALLTNIDNRERTFIFITDSYKIEGEGVDLKLITRKLPLVKKSPFKSIKNYLLTVDPKEKRIVTQNEQMPFFTHYKYDGWQHLKDRHKRGNFPIPVGWNLKINGQDALNNKIAVTIPGGQSKMIDIEIKAPVNAQIGDEIPINVLALTPAGKIAGGITQFINVK